MRKMNTDIQPQNNNGVLKKEALSDESVKHIPTPETPNHHNVSPFIGHVGHKRAYRLLAVMFALAAIGLGIAAYVFPSEDSPAPVSESNVEIIKEDVASDDKASVEEVLDARLLNLKLENTQISRAEEQSYGYTKVQGTDTYIAVPAASRWVFTSTPTQNDVVDNIAAIHTTLLESGLSLVEGSVAPSSSSPAAAYQSSDEDYWCNLDVAYGYEFYCWNNDSLSQINTEEYLKLYDAQNTTQENAPTLENVVITADFADQYIVGDYTLQNASLIGYEVVNTVALPTDGGAVSFYKLTDTESWFYFSFGQAIPDCTEFVTDPLPLLFAQEACFDSASSTETTVADYVNQ